jgi:GNAT superfamily N-acetyltransferase
MSENEIKESDIIIRNYRTSDYSATLEILNQLNEKYDIGFTEKKWKESSGLRQFKVNLKRITLVGELKSTGEIVSMGVIEAKKDAIGNYIGYMDDFATKQAYIGKHVGKFIAERAIQVLESWGCESVRINLGYDVNSKLIDVFGRIGFKPLLIVLEKKFNKKE